MSEASPTPPLLRIAGHFLSAGMAFALGWWLWSHSNGDWWMFRIYAALCALAGVKRLGRALVEIVHLLWRRHRFVGYQAQGSAPRADMLAGEDDLKRRGLLK